MTGHEFLEQPLVDSNIFLISRHSFDGMFTTYVSQSFENTTSSVGGSDLYYVPPALVVLLSVLYGSVSAISIVGNLLVIMVVCRYKSMQTVTNFFIVNLRSVNQLA